MIQHELIARVRDLCRTDGRLAAALTYGSFVTGAADEHSDIEFWLFAAEPVDPGAWLARVGPIRHVVVNEFGAHVVFFPGLIRGEFHFAAAADVPSVATWPSRDVEIIVDRDGELARALAAPPPHQRRDLTELAGRFANWLLLAHQVAARGELLRAVDALTHAQRHLLWMVRLAGDHTQHWLTPSRAAETDLPPDVVAALHRTIAGPGGVDEALRAAWRCGRPYVPSSLLEELDLIF